MRILELEIENFRKFQGTHRVTGFQPGLNLISGPNEMGKSTLLAALKAALFERHRSKAEAIKAYQTDGHDLAPRVKLGFETDGGRWTIEKRFLKNPYAMLTCPDGRQIDGEEAEEALEQALGFEKPGSRGSTPDSLGTWGVLWVEQGQSFGLPTLSDPARMAIHSCLEAEVGAVAGGRRGQALIKAVDDALGELLDKRHKPRGRFKELQERKSARAAEVAELEGKLAGLKARLDRLPGLLTEERRLSDPEVERQMAQAVQQARGKQQSLMALLEEIGRAERVKGKAEIVRDRTRTRLQERRALTQNEADAIGAVSRSEELVRELVEQHSGSSKALEELQAALEKARDRVGAAENNVRLTERRRDAASLAATLDRLRNQLEHARVAANRLDEAVGKIAAIRVDKAALGAIEKTEQRLLRARASLQAAATHLCFEVTDDAARRIRLGASALGECRRADIVRETPIVIGRIVVTPQIADSAVLETELAEAERQLSGLLDAAGAANSDAARALYEHRRAAEGEARDAEAEIRLYAPGDGKRGVAGIDGLEREVAALESAVSVNTPQLGEPLMPDVAEEAVTSARTWLAAAQTALRHAEDDLAPARARAEEVHRRRTAEERSLQEARNRWWQLADALTAARSELADENLACSLSETESQLKTAAQIVERLQAQRGPESAEQIATRIHRFDAALDGRRRERTEIEIQIREHRAAISVVEGEGVEEKLAALRTEVELLDRDLATCQRDADVLSLLIDVLRDAEHRAQEQFLAPVTRRIEPYLSILFNGATIQMDEDLRITGIVRDGGMTETFDKLSHGTREQVAVLTRLALAELLAERGRPAAVILDDALVFSDDERIELMFDVLTMASKNMQILVLTCRNQRFAGLGAPLVKLTPSTAAEAATTPLAA